MNETRLIDRKELIKRHPALGAKKYRLDWLIRTRTIPVVVVGRHVFFNEAERDNWVRKNSSQSKNGERR